MTQKIYDLKSNWHLLQPHLNDENVVNVLGKCLEDYKEQFPNCRGVGLEPWTYSPSDGWHVEISERVEKDEDFQKEVSLLDEEDEFYEDDYCDIHNKYSEKYEPKRGEIDFYKFMHGCHWIAPFVVQLLENALKVDSWLLSSETHSVACFEKDGVTYFADILLDWDSVEDLMNFITGGSEDE